MVIGFIAGRHSELINLLKGTLYSMMVVLGRGWGVEHSVPWWTLCWSVMRPAGHEGVLMQCVKLHRFKSVTGEIAVRLRRRGVR